MKNANAASADALPRLICEARAKVDILRKTLLREFDLAQIQGSSASSAVVVAMIHDYGIAIQTLNGLEDQIEQDSSTKYGLVQGNAVDLDAARREVADRVARFRERCSGQ